MALRNKPPSYLKRLGPEWYRGKAWVHWVMTIDGWKKGWLDDGMHAGVRELLVHACGRYHLACPAYCLMPDHGHFLWMGLCEISDQMKAGRFFRKHWNRLLEARGLKLQQQGYEHVLNEHERNRTEFEDALFYVLANPERGGLVGEWREWGFLGSVVAGDPELDPREKGRFPGIFWKIHHKEVARLEGA